MIKDGKIMHYTTADTIRDIVKIANELNIKREDIVSLLSNNGRYYLVYYYGGKINN